MDNPTPSQKKKRFRLVRLDGKSPSKPRGRHAAKADAADDTPPQPVAPVPLTERLGYRIGEFATLCGVSTPTIWRGIRDKKIETTEIGGVRVIPRAFAVRCGLIRDA